MMLRQIFLATLLACISVPALGCDRIFPVREPTLAEKIGGLDQIFTGTVVGYLTSDGTRLIGPFPPECLDDEGKFAWWDPDIERLSVCTAYMTTSAALFRVDTAIVGPASNAIDEFAMTWGDGDCNINFTVGEQWLIAGLFTQQLEEPIRDDEIAVLRKLAARPAFDFRTLYPGLYPGLSP